MKTIEVKLYTINELPTEQAKDKARNWWRESLAWDTFWSEHVIDEAVQQGELLGIAFKQRDIPLRNGKTRQEPCIFWSGFSNQGDGACFEGTWRAADVKADQVAEGWGDSPSTAELKRLAARFQALATEWPDASFTVHSGRYSHKYCTSFEVSLGEAADDLETCTQGKWGEVESELITAARDFMDWTYRALERDYDYANSDEQIDETCEANEHTFLSDGTRFK